VKFPGGNQQKNGIKETESKKTLEARVGIEPEIVAYLLDLQNLETDEIG
jgi:hypothetical protein